MRRARAARIGAALVALVVATTLAACGSPKPLDKSLDDGSRQSLETVWVARLTATDPAQMAVGVRTEKVKAMTQACASLSPSDAMLSAISGTCGPLATFTKLSAVLPERCATPAAICQRALDRIAAATDELATTLGTLNVHAKLETADLACRAQFTTTDAQSQAYADLSGAYRVLSVGIEQRDKDISALGQRRIDDADAALRPTGSLASRIAAFRSACGFG